MKNFCKLPLRTVLVSVLVLVSMNAFGQTGLDGYSSLNFGARFFKREYTDPGPGIKVDFKGQGLEAGIDGYIFGKGKSLGFYASIGLHFPMQVEGTVSGVPRTITDTKDLDVAFDLTATIGLASRTSIGKNIVFLVGLGPSVTYGGYVKGRDTNLEFRQLDISLGVGLNPSILLKVSEGVALTVGARASVNFFAMRFVEEIQSAYAKTGSIRTGGIQYTPVKLYRKDEKKLTDYLEFNVTAYAGITFSY